MTIPNNPGPGREWTNEVTGVTYRWDGERWFIVSSSDEDLIENFVTKVEFEGRRAENQEEHAEIEAEQGVQNNQINALETQVQLLAGVKAVGRWTYRRRVDSSPRPPNLRTFYGTDVRDIATPLTSWENTNLLMISKTDLDDNTFTFSDFEEGDKVEVIAKDGTSAVYGTVTNNPSIDSYANMVIDVERWRGGPVEEAEYLISAYRPGSSNGEVDLEILDQRYLIKTGDTMSAPLNFKRGSEKENVQFKISPNGGADYATNIYSFYGQMRLRTTHTNNEGDHVGSHIVLSPNGGSPETRIYNVVAAGENTAVPKSYVDSVAGVPVGSIMIWLQSNPPDGWFKLQGSNFDVASYPLLHAYLQTTSGYTSGQLPNWGGRYPGEYGDHLTGTLGTFANPRTAKPNAGSPYSSDSIPNGTTRTFSPAGQTNAYSNGTARPSIDSGWDDTTRPLTVVVHYIIKHD